MHASGLDKLLPAAQPDRSPGRGASPVRPPARVAQPKDGLTAAVREHTGRLRTADRTGGSDGAARSTPAARPPAR
jgi:hypothetical protein